MKRRVTGSQLERVMNCPTSVTLPHLYSTSEAAERGSVAHKFLELVPAKGRDAALEEIAERAPEHWELCAALDVSVLPVGAQFAQEVSLAFNASTRKAREIGRGLSFREREEVYAACGADEIPMTLDVVAVAADHVFVADFKFGWKPVTPAKYNWQVRIGCLAAARAYGKGKARGLIIRPREDGPPYQNGAWFEMPDLWDFEDELADLPRRIAHAASESAAGTPMPYEGKWCEFCPAQLACPAKTALIRRLAAGTEMEELEMLIPLTPESAAVAFHRLQAARKMLSRIESAIYALAKVQPIPLGNGLVLEEREVDGNEKLLGGVVHRVLTELYGVEVANAAVEFTATKKGLTEALREAAKKVGAPLAKLSREALARIREEKGASKPVRRKIDVFEVRDV